MNDAHDQTETIDRLPLALGALGSACAWCWLFATLNGNAFLAFFPAATNALRAIELFGLLVGLVVVELVAWKVSSTRKTPGQAGGGGSGLLRSTRLTKRKPER